MIKINRQNKKLREISILYGEDDSININIFNNEILMEIVGTFDSNLKELEKLTGSKIYFREILLQLKEIKNQMRKLKMQFSI